MSELNPNIKIAKSRGIDLPIMYVYLAGYMSGEKLNETMEWRKKPREYYKNYEPIVCGDTHEVVGYESFPIAFLDPYNGKEFNSIDQKGLTSSISSNAIFDGDLMSVKKSDLIVANIDTFGSDRPMIGTYWELGINTALGKPFIIIAPKKRAGDIFDENGNKTGEYTYFDLATKHPFLNRASVIVESVDQLIKEKHLETFYRRIAGAIY